MKIFLFALLRVASGLLITKLGMILYGFAATITADWAALLFMGALLLCLIGWMLVDLPPTHMNDSKSFDVFGTFLGFVCYMLIASLAIGMIEGIFKKIFC